MPQKTKFRGHRPQIWTKWGTKLYFIVKTDKNRHARSLNDRQGQPQMIIDHLWPLGNFSRPEYSHKSNPPPESQLHSRIIRNINYIYFASNCFSDMYNIALEHSYHMPKVRQHSITFRSFRIVLFQRFNDAAPSSLSYVHMTLNQTCCCCCYRRHYFFWIRSDLYIAFKYGNVHI